MASSPQKLRLSIEWGIVFVLVPGLLLVYRHAMSNRIILSIWVVAIFSFLYLIRRPDFDRKKLGWGNATKTAFGHVLLRFLCLGIVLSFITAWLVPDLLFRFPREKFNLWLFVMVAYPLFSAYPQEVFFRTFFFERYAPLFSVGWGMIFAAGVGFALYHVFFGNWIAPLLCLLGGILISWGYREHESTLLAAIEHGLWGDLLFTVGLGWYFYGGSIS